VLVSERAFSRGEHQLKLGSKTGDTLWESKAKIDDRKENKFQCK
jgi:hypothetical protein